MNENLYNKHLESRIDDLERKLGESQLLTEAYCDVINSLRSELQKKDQEIAALNNYRLQIDAMNGSHITGV